MKVNFSDYVLLSLKLGVKYTRECLLLAQNAPHFLLKTEFFWRHFSRLEEVLLSREALVLECHANCLLFLKGSLMRLMYRKLHSDLKMKVNWVFQNSILFTESSNLIYSIFIQFFENCHDCTFYFFFWVMNF